MSFSGIVNEISVLIHSTLIYCEQWFICYIFSKMQNCAVFTNVISSMADSDITVITCFQCINDICTELILLTVIIRSIQIIPLLGSFHLLYTSYLLWGIWMRFPDWKKSNFKNISLSNKGFNVFCWHMKTVVEWFSQLFVICFYCFIFCFFLILIWFIFLWILFVKNL